MNRSRPDDAEIDVEAVLHLLGKPPRLGEQVLRVEQHDVGLLIGADRQMRKNCIFEAGSHHDVVDPVRVERPAHHIVRVQLLDVYGCLKQAHPGILPNYD